MRGMALVAFRALAAVSGFIWLAVGAMVPILLLAIPLPFVAAYTASRYPQRSGLLVVLPAAIYLALWLPLWINPPPYTDVASTVPLTLALTVPAASAALLAFLPRVTFSNAD